jgi:signal peptidase I
LRSRGDRSSAFVTSGGEGSLSRQALIELLQAVLDRDMPFRFRALGFSMSPFIRDGDVITISRLPSGSPGFGRVVAAIHPRTGRLVIHRVVGRRGNWYLTKGDSSPDVDGFVPKAKIQGYVRGVEREGKPVFFGLGSERLLIALLSRWGLLSPLIYPISRLIHPIKRRLAA